MKFDSVIVGAGLAGSTIAERLANVYNQKVLLIEVRNHIGGNTYDYFDENGVLVQKYGPHIFHTNSLKVWNYLSKFTEWNNFEHRVIAKVLGKEVNLPISLMTLEQLFDRSFTPDEMAEYFERHRVSLAEIANSRDVVVSQVGTELYELFFKNYTKKQWGVYPEELEPEVTKRLPVRSDHDTRYFTDSCQGIPRFGFTRMFEAMLDSGNISILLNTDYKLLLRDIHYDRLFFTGPIDYFFDYKHGRLPYRSLDFRLEYHEREKFQNAAVVNYPNDHDYTRITEFKHFYMQKHHGTTICYEYPLAEGDPYYPIPNKRCHEQYLKYQADADALQNTYFVGRLAQYKYMNMDQVVLNALNLVEEINHGS